MRLLCLLLLLGLLVLLSFLSNHAGFDARAQQLLICFVLDRHLRSSVCGTRPRTGPHSWRRFAFFEDNSTARAELPILVYVCGGGPKRKHQEDTLPSQYGSLMDSFCKRTQRTWVEEIGDGHCGIRSFWRQFDETIGTEHQLRAYSKWTGETCLRAANLLELHCSCTRSTIWRDGWHHFSRD